MFYEYECMSKAYFRRTLLLIFSILMLIFNILIQFMGMVCLVAFRFYDWPFSLISQEIFE